MFPSSGSYCVSLQKSNEITKLSGKLSLQIKKQCSAITQKYYRYPGNVLTLMKF